MTYVLFHLPSGGGGMAPAFAAARLRQELREWQKKYSVECETQIEVYDFKLFFFKPENLTLFALTANEFIGRSFQIIDSPINL